MEQKSFWSEIVGFAKTQVPGAIKKYAPLIAVKVFGKAGGLYTWLIKYGLTKLAKYVKPYAEAMTFILDKRKLDEASVKQYEDLKKEGATNEELKKKRLDLLNGNSSKL